MERLIVDNFLNLKHIELDVAKINIIIGRQAQGKSILAKLLYFFKDFFINYRLSVTEGQNKRDFDQSVKEEFTRMFPEYSWIYEQFKIIYKINEYEIILENNKNKSNVYKFKLNYSDKLSRLRNKLIKDIEKNQDSESEIDTFEQFIEFSINRTKYIETLVYKTLFKSDRIACEEPIFIPAGRSFFSNVQKNVFSLLSDNISIDYFLIEFGSTYEKIKEIYTKKKILHDDKSKVIDEIIQKIIIGNYRYEQEEDWIYRSDKSRVKLINASSGQQESVPLIVILSTLPFLRSKQLFFIEEPEAHLFPSSQKSIVELISMMFNITKKKHGFLLTTHSPYILSAFNNLIQAGNTRKKIADKKDTPKALKKLFSVVSEDKILDIENFGVYTLENGELISIIDEENRLIDTNIIDETYDEFFDIFSELTELEFEE